MRHAITLLDVGSGSEPLIISGWFVETGDFILEGDQIVELLMSGVKFDIAAIHSGRLVEIVRIADSSVQPGDVLGWIEDDESP